MGALAVLTAGCAAPSNRNDRENWVCERTVDGRDWNCNQQRIGNGASPAAQAAVPAASAGAVAHPVARADAAPDAASGSGRSLEEKFNKAADPPERDAAKWNATLPTLSTGVADTPLDSPLKPVAPGQRKPPPEPEPFFARWDKKADAKVLSESSGGAAVAPSAAIATASPAPAKRRSPPLERPAVGTGARAADSGRAYTVQIGAFKSDRAARAYIAQHKLDALPDLVVHPAASQDPENYVVVTFGRFATVREAQDGWRRSGAPSDLEVWIRPTSTTPRPLAKTAPTGTGSAPE